MNPMEIIIPKTPEDAPHDTVPYFIGAKDGWWKNIPTLFGVAQCQMDGDGPPQLMEWKPSFLLNDIKLPGWILSQAHDFFRTIWDKQQSESSVYILYNREDKEFKLYAPEQYVSLSAVNHKLDREELPSGFTPVGTIHSHCNFSAFHSSTDTNDMAKMPGLHITIGHVERDDPEMVFALSMGDQTFDIEREKIIDEEQDRNKWGYDTMPPFWPKFVHTGTAPWGTTGQTVQHTAHKVYGTHPATRMNGYNQMADYKPPGQGQPAQYLAVQRHYPTGFPTSTASNQLMQDWDQRAWNWGGDPAEDVEFEVKDEALSTDVRNWYEGDDALPGESDPFQRYSDIVEQACDEIDELVAWLNAWGFVTSYNVTFDKVKAMEQDNAFREKRMTNVTGTP